jgi:hypothetical protein
MATATKAPVNGAPSRMTLASIQREIGPRPDRILLVGTEGVGKTTFAADAPSPIFLCAEDGLPPVLGSVPRFPEPHSLSDVLDALRTLLRDEHEFRTVVVDTVDWLEPLIWRELCTRNNWLDGSGTSDIEKPGYGKGYVAATEEWRKLLAALDVLRQRKGMEVILLAHATIKMFANPAGDDYSRYECKLHKGAAALVKEWADVNLFAVHEEFAREVRGKATRKGVSTGRRVIHTERTAAWDAKNRYALPSELPLNYADYAAARAACQPADPAELVAEAKQLIADLALDAETQTKTDDWLEVARTSGAAALARAVDRLRSKVAEKGGA